MSTLPGVMSCLACIAVDGVEPEEIQHYPWCAAGIPKNLRGGIASVLFALPIIKHNYAWAGCMPAGDACSMSTLQTC